MSTACPMTRRRFLGHVARLSAALGGTCLAPTLFRGPVEWLDLGPSEAWAAGSLEDLVRQAPEARYWISTRMSEVTCEHCHDAETENGRSALAEGPAFEHDEVEVRCLLCANNCLIPAGERGRCQARFNDRGVLRTLVYGRPITSHVDPIEKKPFYHFLPGSQALSLATSGCALSCKFCQNWEISQARPEDYDSRRYAPESITLTAQRQDAPVVAFTYNEPTIFTEYLTDVARHGRGQGVRHVIVSCGYMNEAPLTEMCEVLDAIKIDLKGFDRGFYRDVCGAELQPVLRSIKQVAASGVHLELVNLVVPTLNDSDRMLRELVKWVSGEVGSDVPVHFTRFHPDYQLRNLPPTPVQTLEKAREMALNEGLNYPYVGNVPGHPGNQTHCPGCGEIVIKRQGFFVVENRIQNGCCLDCGTSIAGVWK